MTPLGCPLTHVLCACANSRNRDKRAHPTRSTRSATSLCVGYCAMTSTRGPAASLRAQEGVLPTAVSSHQEQSSWSTQVRRSGCTHTLHTAPSSRRVDTRLRTFTVGNQTLDLSPITHVHTHTHTPPHTALPRPHQHDEFSNGHFYRPPFCHSEQKISAAPTAATFTLI